MSSRYLIRTLALTCLLRESHCLTTTPRVLRRRDVVHPRSALRLGAVRAGTTDPTARSEAGAAAAAIDRNALSKLDSCRTRTAARKTLSRAMRRFDEGSNDRLYDSVKIPGGLSSRPVSDAELSLQTRTINSKYKIMELIEQNGDRDVDRASLAVLCVFLFGSSSAIVAQQTTEGLPPIVRWVIVFALCFSPLVLVGYGLALPSELSETLVAIQRQVFPSYRKRMIQHEAGHFLVGHLLGWPVKTYRASNAVKNAVEFYPLSDEDAGRDRAEALGFDARKDDGDANAASPSGTANGAGDRPYYSEDGRGRSEAERSAFRDGDSADASRHALEPEDDPKSTWPFRGFDEEALDNLAAISVAGACAEILAYGNAEGGVADLLQLRRIYGAAASAPNREGEGDVVDGSDSSFGSFGDDAKERRMRREGKNRNGGMDEREMDNRTRFALGFAMGLLRQHLGALDALAEVMEGDGSVADCILALETCPNVSGYTVKGDYDRIRRERFRAEEGGVGGWVERTFLGGGKTIDVEDSAAIEGKGGGDRKQGFQLTGDDPLYAALAVAVAFFAWAANGGLSLH